MKKFNFIRLLVLMMVLITCNPHLWAHTATFYCVPKAIWGSNWNDSKTVKIAFRVGDGGGDWWDNMTMSNTGKKYNGNFIYSLTKNDLPNDGVKYVHFYRFNGNTQEADKEAYNDWANCDYWNNHMLASEWVNLTYEDRVSGGNVYFDVENSGWDVSDVQFVIGHGMYSTFYNTSYVTNTKLYYISATDWSDAWYFAFANLCSTWGAEGSSYANRKNSITGKYTAEKTGYTLSSSNYYVFNASSSSNDAAVNSDTPAGYKGITASSLNSTQTIKYAVSENGGTPTELTSGTVPATISMSSYKFVNGTNNSVSTSTASNTLTAGGSNYSATIDAAYTGTTTLTMSSLNSDYAFLGWYDAVSGGTQLEDDETYTFYPRTTTTIYARFSHELNHTVTISRYCTSTSTQISSTTAKIGEVTYSEITAPVIDGYNFTGWDLGNGVSLKSGDNTSSATIHVKTLSSGSYTMTANYTEVLTTTWKIIGATGSGSPFSNSDYASSTDAMSKKSGHSAESVAYKTFNITTVPSGSSYYTFKVAESSSVNYGYGTNGDDHILFDRTKTNQSIYTNSNTDHDLRFKPDALGEYEFKIDYTSSHQLSVTFPATTYTVSYAKGTVVGSDGAISATYSSVSFASGTKVQSGKSVTLTGPAPKTGYTWKGWYTNAAGTEGKIADVGRAITVTVNAAKSLYACYTENEYNTTVAVAPAGTKATTSPAAGTVAIKQVTGTSITASAATDSIFEDWSISGGGLSMVSSSTTNPNTFKATSTGGTITANFTPQWTVAGTMYDNFNWSKTSNLLTGYNTVSSKKHATKTISLAANTTYTFKVKDRSQNQDNGWYGIASGSTATYTYAIDNTAKDITTASGNQNISLTTAAAGDYVFDFNVDDKKIAVDFPTSWKMTIGQKTIYDPNVSPTSDASTTGGYVTAEDDASNTITNNQYVADDASVTFTAHPATGYAFKGWYKNADCSTSYIDYSDIDGSVVIDNEAMTLTLNDIDENKAVYAKYEEIMTTISVSANHGTFKIDSGEEIEEMGIGNYLEVGVHTTHDITVMTDDEGFYFSNWNMYTAYSCQEEGKEDVNFSISGDKDNEDNRSITVTGLGRADGCSLDFLQLEYKSLETIHFRNRFDDGTNPATHWENVYVFFDIYWSEYSGQQAIKTSGNNSSKGLHVAMTDRGYHDMWWAYVPRWVTRNNKYNVAFANKDVSGDNYFLYEGEACGRSDYRVKTNMFVPYHVSNKTVNGVKYFDSGYWMRYTTGTGAESGYYVERRTGSKTYSRLGEFTVTSSAWDDATLEYRLRVDGMNKTDYIIWSEGNIKYKTWTGITTAKCDTVALKEDNTDDSYFVISLTSEGEYVLTIDQSGDRMKLSVNYPVAIGDYVLEHTYTGKQKRNPATDSTYVTRTNIIKAAEAGENTRYSMYLNKTDATLKLRKCTSISAGTPVWSTGTTTNLSTITSKLASDGNGVYQFDLAVNTSDDQVSAVDSVRLYTGNFYIKTDAADGGWVTYKKNVLTKNTVNFDRGDATTFDYYMCKYFASKDCNIKSVIANDYCNQLSDTVKGDGIARMYAGEPYVPIDGTSIRFSYNSATNETKRAYLEGSYHNGFLNIIPSTDNNVYRTISGYKYDLYDNLSDSAKLKFEDNGNYVYEMDLSVIPGAKAGVRAVYNNKAHEQMLIPSTNTLLGGSGSSEYGIRVVYDFKTNFMMSSFVLTNSTINESLSDFDMLWIRHKDDSPTQLTLGADKTLSNVRPIGAIEFRYDEMCSSSSSGDWVDLSSWTAASRPYLKYFISFPFDVHVGSVFGLNDAYYGLDYVIQKYDGATRAADGLFAGDGDNYWINLTKDSIMHANEGYCLILDNDYARWSSSTDMWFNKGAGSKAYIYFPAMDEIETIESDTEIGTKVPEHECKVNRWWSGSTTKNHTQTDSHWNLIGQPFFHDAYIKSCTNKIDTINLGAYYYLDYLDNKWYPQAFDKEHSQIKAMSSFFVQWAGDITWTTNAANDKWKDTPVAAPRRAKAEGSNNYLIRLNVEFNGKLSDWTFVRLEDEANDDFVLREDMFKMYNNGIPNIYTFAGSYDVAYNAVPVKNQIIPMGVLIRKNGTYTFSMPSNFSGTVTLIDNFSQTRTNLALEDYEVYLEKGTIDDRFELEINIQNAPTAIDGASDGKGSLKDGKAHKFIMNDLLYILKDGVLYDAQGRRL